jgi:hypothetical protein
VRGLGALARTVAVIAAVAAALGSATAPERHDVDRTTTLGASYDEAWAATIDLFAERGWTIANAPSDEACQAQRAGVDGADECVEVL